ncbi:MAG UNVERIFIED_CONTAM: hypothetical protein LVR29_03000 [Microcystis novacekii LVE1205-3]
MDSIKGGELIADFAKQCSVAGKVDPTTLANASLQEILEIRARSDAHLNGVFYSQFSSDHRIQKGCANDFSPLARISCRKNGFPGIVCPYNCAYWTT